VPSTPARAFWGAQHCAAGENLGKSSGLEHFEHWLLLAWRFHTWSFCLNQHKSTIYSGWWSPNWLFSGVRSTNQNIIFLIKLWPYSLWYTMVFPPNAKGSGSIRAGRWMPWPLSLHLASSLDVSHFSIEDCFWWFRTVQASDLVWLSGHAEVENQSEI